MFQMIITFCKFLYSNNWECNVTETEVCIMIKKRENNKTNNYIIHQFIPHHPLSFLYYNYVIYYTPVLYLKKMQHLQKA